MTPPTVTKEEVLELAGALLNWPFELVTPLQIDGAFYLQFFDERLREALYRIRRWLLGSDEARPLRPDRSLCEPLAVSAALSAVADPKVFGSHRYSPWSIPVPEELMQDGLNVFFRFPGEDPKSVRARVHSGYRLAAESTRDYLLDPPSLLYAAIWGQPCLVSDFSIGLSQAGKIASIECRFYALRFDEGRLALWYEEARGMIPVAAERGPAGRLGIGWLSNPIPLVSVEVQHPWPSTATFVEICARAVAEHQGLARTFVKRDRGDHIRLAASFTLREKAKLGSRDALEAWDSFAGLAAGAPKWCFERLPRETHNSETFFSNEAKAYAAHLGRLRSLLSHAA